MPTVNPKFTTEIWPDFKVERHEDYTVIWPMRFYRDMEEKDYCNKEKNSGVLNDFVIPLLIWLFQLFVIILWIVYIVSFIIWLFR